MILTKVMRRAFVRAALADVPATDYAEEIRRVATAACVAALPEKVRRVYDDPATRGYLHTEINHYGNGCHVGVTVPCPENGDFAPKLSAESLAQIKELSKAKIAQEQKLDELEGMLTGAAESVRTRAKLAQMLPEFEKYLPADDAAANRSVPVVQNIVADFVKAGWPKGARKCANPKS